MATWILWALFAVLFIYNLLDVWQTTLLLSVGAIEVNPIMNYFLIKYGPESLLWVKIVVFICLGILLYIHQMQFKKE